MKTRIIAATAAALMLVGVTPAAAVTTYYYQGGYYTDFVTPEPWAVGFTPDMSISASISMLNPLAASSSTQVLSWYYDPFGNWSATVHPDFASATVSDGRSLYETHATPGNFVPISPGLSEFFITLITDDVGQIVDWLFGASYFTRYVNLDMYSAFSRPGTDYAMLYRTGLTSTASGQSGTWTVANYAAPAVVPLPAPLLLLCIGLMSLFGLRRLRRKPQPAHP